MAARKHRPAADAPIWLYGVHAVRAALANPARRALRLIATESAAAALGAAAARAEIVPRQAIDAVVPRGAVHQGLALKAMPLAAADLGAVLAEAPQGRAALVALDHVTDPHNVGAILRTAAALGALALVTTRRHAPGETGALAKAAAGALERVPLVAVPNLARALGAIADAGFWVMGLDARAPRTLAEAAAPARTAIVLGAEGEGLRRLTRERCDEVVRLVPGLDPGMTRAADSLNVSVAAAIALWELARAGRER